MKKTQRIAFQNAVHPISSFDLVRLEDLYTRKYEGHSVEDIHRVDFFLLLFVTEGTGYHMVDFQKHPLRKGTLVTIRKDQVHRFFKSSNVTGHLILFTDEFLISYLEKLETQKSMQLFNELLFDPVVHFTEGQYDEINGNVSRMGEEYYEVFDEYSLGIIRSELHILLSKLYRIKSRSSGSKVLEGKKYLSEFISFQNLVEQQVFETRRVGDYAQKMLVSTKTLNNITKSLIQKTAKEFIDEICIKQIKRLLINTTLTVTEIAYSTGFDETTNFYKYFKRHVGKTPEQFRG